MTFILNSIWKNSKIVMQELNLRLSKQFFNKARIIFGSVDSKVR